MAQNETFPIPKEKLVGGLIALLSESGSFDAVRILQRSRAELKVAGYDNWNGGTTDWTLVLYLEPAGFAPFMDDGTKREMEDRLGSVARMLASHCTNHWISVALAIDILNVAPWEPGSTVQQLLLSGGDGVESGYADIDAFLAARELEIVGELGEGGTARIFHARRLRFGADVALKVFDSRALVFASESARKKARERLSREAKLLAEVNNRHVVRLHDLGIVAGSPVLVLEHVAGRDARKDRLATGPWDEAKVQRFLNQLLEGLEELHQKGIAHRDVSPNNAMLREGSDEAVLIDLGLGYREEAAAGTRLTTQALGTPGYIAPERANDPLIADPTVDIYSVGALTYYLAAGHNLGNPTNIVLPKGYSPSLAAIVEKAVHLDPKKRFQSAAEMKVALQACATSICAPSSLQQGASMVHGGSSGVLIELSNEDVWELLELGDREISDTLTQTVTASVRRVAVQSLETGIPGVPAGSASYMLVACSRLWVEKRFRYTPPARCNDESLHKAYCSLTEMVAPNRPRIDTEMARSLASSLLAADQLREDEYDVWRPGMASGSGIRAALIPTRMAFRRLEDALGLVFPRIGN